MPCRKATSSTGKADAGGCTEQPLNARQRLRRAHKDPALVESAWRQRAARLLSSELGMRRAEQAPVLRALCRPDSPCAALAQDTSWLCRRLRVLRVLEGEFPGLRAGPVIQRCPQVLRIDKRRLRRRLHDLHDALVPQERQAGQNGIGAVATKCPAILLEPARVERYLHLLCQVLSRGAAAKVLLRYPHCLNIRPQLIVRNFKSWQRALGVPVAAMEAKVVQNPWLLTQRTSREQVIAAAEATGLTVSQVRCSAGTVAPVSAASASMMSASTCALLPCTLLGILPQPLHIRLRRVDEFIPAFCASRTNTKQP